jgi:hypothetical protein
MAKNQNTTYGPQATPEAKLSAIFQDAEFGVVTLRVINGTLSPGHEPRVRYSGKPRSHLRASKRDPTDKPQPSRAEAIRDLLDDIGPLSGIWEVTVQVSNTIPFKWDFEEVRPL